MTVESLLGLRRQGDRLHLAPCVPAHWPAFGMTYRFGATTYVIAVRQLATEADGTAAAPPGVRVRLDGIEQHDRSIRLVDDGAEHLVSVVIAYGAEENEDVTDAAS